MISDKTKAAILDKCCQKVDCLARGEVIDAEGAPDLHQTSPESGSEYEALPCPFCGNKPRVSADMNGGAIRCETDDCFGPRTTAQYLVDAIKQWNRRFDFAQRPDQWKCLAPSKAACAWPDCGCDPAATHVIQALVDQGWQPPSPDTSTDRPHPSARVRVWNEEKGAYFLQDSSPEGNPK
jgi:hypothetical protein